MFAAFDLAAEHGFTNVLQDVGRKVMRRSFDNDYASLNQSSPFSVDVLLPNLLSQTNIIPVGPLGPLLKLSLHKSQG